MIQWKSSSLAIAILFAMVACSPAERSRPADPDTIVGAWVLSVGWQNAGRFLRDEPFTPLGFDFSSSDSVEVFCKPRQGERYTTYRFSGDTLRIRPTDSVDWMRFPHRIKQDTMYVYRDADTVTYMRVDMSEFRMMPTERVYLTAGSWGWVMGLIFNKDGSMEVRSNGYGPDSYNPYAVDKIYKLNRSPVEFEKLNRSLQRLHYIALSERGRQLYDSAAGGCFDGTEYSILFESDSLRETTYITCSDDFEFFRYGDYIIRKLELDGRTPIKMVAYDSIFESPFHYCGRFWNSADKKRVYTLSELLYISQNLRAGSRAPDKSESLPGQFLIACSRADIVVRTNGRIFQITSGKDTTNVDAGKDVLAAIEGAKKRRVR